MISFFVYVQIQISSLASIGREFAENTSPYFVSQKGVAYIIIFQISSRGACALMLNERWTLFLIGQNLKFERRRNFERERKIDDSGSKTKKVGRHQLKIERRDGSRAPRRRDKNTQRNDF